MNDLEQLGFRALADTTRRDILQMLASDELTIREIAANFQMTRAAVKKHLTILDEGGLITTRKVGRTRVNTLNATGLRRVVNWFGFFDDFWDSRLAALKSDIERDVQ